MKKRTAFLLIRQIGFQPENPSEDTAAILNARSTAIKTAKRVALGPTPGQASISRSIGDEVVGNAGSDPRGKTDILLAV